MSDFRICSTDDAATTFHHVAATARPAGAQTQWLSFRLRSMQFFSHSPRSHFAIVLRAQLGRDAQGTPVSIAGRGICVGDTSAANDAHCRGLPHRAAFGGCRGMQIESFWVGGNFLWRDSGRFATGLDDRFEYRVQLHVNDQRWVAFQAVALDGEEVVDSAAAEVCDSAEHPVPDDASGILIALGRGDRESGPWQVDFLDIAHGWF